MLYRTRTADPTLVEARGLRGYPREIVCTAFLCLVVCGLAQAQIAETPLPERSERIEHVQLLAPGAGLIVTRGRLLLTEDNGKSWSDRTPSTAGKPEILDVQFRDPQAGRVLFSASERSIHLRT